MGDIVIRQEGREFRAPDAATLREWAREGRIRREAQILEPPQQRWIAASELPHLHEFFADRGLKITLLAQHYRQLVLWVGFQLLLSVVVMLNCFLLFVAPALAVSVVALPYYAFRTAEALGSRSAALWAVAMLVPFVNVLTLLSLSSRATAACRANGVEVGFLGPRI